MSTVPHKHLILPVPILDEEKKFVFLLTLKDPFISESFEIKIELNFYFHTSLWCHRRFYEGLFTLSGIGSLRVNFKNERNCVIIKLPCLIKAKARTGNRDYINCEKYISRMQLFRVVP